MRILITGAAGFIGSHLSETLLNCGHDVVGVDNLDPYYEVTQKLANVAKLERHARFRFWRRDFRDLPVRGESFDVVVHLAARPGVRASVEDPVRTLEVNVEGTQHLLGQLGRLRCDRLIFASSSSVYGGSKEAPWHEGTPALPLSPYAASKVAGEALCHAHHALSGCGVTVLRFFTVYGPRQRPDLAIHKFARLMAAGKPLPIYGAGTARDYTYVGDAVEMVLRAIDYTRPGRYDVLNIGGGTSITLMRMVHELEKAMGMKAVLDQQGFQPGDALSTLADSTHLERTLGPMPRTPFSEGIKRFTEWFRK